MYDKLKIDKVRGSLVGGACGDALGYPVEFIFSYKDIQEKYGEGGITEYDREYIWINDSKGKLPALVSDDTQMTLYTAEGLLTAIETDAEYIPTIRDAYLAWFHGQTGEPVNIGYDSNLSKINDLNQRRAPGNTCLTALAAIVDGRNVRNDSKGCGGIMRVAPIGLYGVSHGWSDEDIAAIAGKVAEITHLHSLSTYPSAAFALIVKECVVTKDIDKSVFREIVEKSIGTVESLYGENAPYMNDFKRLMHNAMELSTSIDEDCKVIETSIGGGWVAEETLAIAVFSVLRHINDFKSCIVCSVNHGGDSDSTGAVAGNIIGAITGYDNIPTDFTDKLQFRELLLSYSDALSTNTI